MQFKIGGVPEHFNYPWRLAIEHRAFDDLNVELHWSDMTGGTGQMIKGLETGSLDIAVLLSEGIARAILQGCPAKILDVYVTSPLQWGIHIPEKSVARTPKDFITPTFAISRFGSGSHLMAYVLAKQFDIPITSLKFNVIGDVYGGIWALEHNEADLFLWEKYTTQPFVDKGSCRSIGQINTPWPCFVIACRSALLPEHRDVLRRIIAVVQSYALHLKKERSSAAALAWRYHLKQEEVARWLEETEWNTQKVSLTTSLESTLDFLLEAQLVDSTSFSTWQETLF
ncbi:MAG: ABC transporter substrate-binding protein [Flavobacteriia bacterium]|nr:ABC transporter substrate-binding protein [Flavobacteriia bacterium]